MAALAAPGTMSENPFLNGTILALSIFNAVLLAWLGLTVLLNSDRLRWGIWIAGGGMLLGSAFFISHAALVALGLMNLGWDTLIFWWSVGLLSAVALPFLWYVIMLWYAGYWEDPDSALHRRQRPWLVLSAALLLLGIALIITGGISLGLGSPRFGQWFIFLRFSNSGIPAIVLGFSFYMLLSIALALDALRSPGPSARVMGNLARRRARPWLAAASIALFFVAVIVTIALFWIGRLSRELLLSEVYQKSGSLLALLDLALSLLIGLVIILLGQAIVSYELFTGKTLPRRGLRRQWQRALLLASAAGILIAGSVTLPIRPVYGLLLSVLLMTLFFALVSWRSYIERERLMNSLRPFVASQELYRRLLDDGQTAGKADPLEEEWLAPFYALCRDVLDAQRAYLLPAGPLTTLIDQPLIYPPAPVGERRVASGSTPATGTSNSQFVTLTSLPAVPPSSIFHPTSTEPAAINPAHYQGAIWAVPLWGDRGLSGVLLLGEKRGGGLYTQEEIEIAAVTGERLIDTQAAAEMSRRLLALQRQTMTQTQVVDQQTRRVLHDEILPDLHAALITLSEDGRDDQAQLMQLLTGTHRKISDLLHELPAAGAPEVERLGLLAALRRTVEQEYAAAFDEVRWQVDEEAQKALEGMSNLPAGVIYYAAREALRNAARYGRMPGAAEPFVLTMSLCRAQGQRVQWIVEDNGRGFSTTDQEELSEGQGLVLHSTLMAIIGGSLAVDTIPGAHTRVIFFFPTS